MAEADEVINEGYELADAYSDLFDAEGQDTPEDIFKVTFNAVSSASKGSTTRPKTSTAGAKSHPPRTSSTHTSPMTNGWHGRSPSPTTAPSRGPSGPPRSGRRTCTPSGSPRCC